MSLSARIAIGPPLWLTAAEAVAVAGGLTLAAVTLDARLGPSWPLAIAISALAFGSARWIRLRRQAAGIRSIFVSESPEITLRGSDGVSTLWCLDDTTTAWPGFVGLALARPDRPGSGRTLVALCSTMDAEDARRLHRYLLWASRGGCRRVAEPAVVRRIR